MHTFSLPRWMKALGAWFSKASKWLDDNVFPLPATEVDLKLRKAKDIEFCANMLWKQVKACKTLEDTYEAMYAIRDFRAIWGECVQVKSSVDSLNLALYRKQQQVMNEILAK